MNHKIYFGAPNGGVAKVKALAKLKGFLMRVSEEFLGNPKVDVLLKKLPRNGNGNGGAPDYKLRGRASYSNAIIKESRPSAIFVVTRS